MPTESHVATSLKRALQGAALPNLRAAGFRMEDELIIVVFVFAATPSEEEVEAAQIISTEVISDFPDLDSREEIHFADSGALPHVALWRLVYERV